MNEIYLIILSTFALSLITFVAVILLVLKKDLLDRIIFLLVALAAGTMLGSVFLHLLPESLTQIEPGTALKITLVSILGFFILEKFLSWNNNIQAKEDVKSYGYLNLTGDTIHNFIDGVIIATAFMTDIRVGFVTVFAIALHEIPQELSDFAVLIYAGFNRRKAILVNFLVGVSSVMGGIAGYYLAYSAGLFVPYLLPIAAGGFLYIATSDLVPELRKESDSGRSFQALIMIFVGVAAVYVAGILE